MPTYTPNTPLVSQPINSTQPIINDNFTVIDTYLRVDHTALNASNQGTHQAIHLEQQGSDPATTSTQTAFYSKLDALSVLRQFMREPSNGAVRQLTGNVVQGGAPGYFGETMILNGIVVKYGLLTLASNLQTFTWASLGLTDFPNAAFGAVIADNNPFTTTAPIPCKAIVTTFDITVKLGTGFPSTSAFFIALGN